MSKKSTTAHPNTVFAVDDFAHLRKKRLGIKQIREFVELLRGLPDGAPMPDWSDLTIGDRFAIALRLIPAEHWEQLLGKVEGHLRRYENGVDIPLTVITALAAETEIPLDWFAYGKPIDRYPTLSCGQSEAGGHGIKKLAFKVSAGNGETVLDENASHVHFPGWLLQQYGISSHNARLMIGAGESMRPTINDGDLLLVDVSENAKQIVEGKIYVFSVGEDAFVKRLRRVGSEVIMISDNREPAFADRAVPKHQPFQIYGRVKWAGRSL